MGCVEMLSSKNVKLGIAPLTWSNDDMPELLGRDIPFEQCVSEMALAGFQGTEIGRKYPSNVTELNKALGMRGLTVCNAWFSSFLTTEPYEKTLASFIEKCDFLKAAGAKNIGVCEQGHSIQGQINTPVLTEKPVFTDEEWDKLSSGLNKLALVAKEKGMILGFHHHMGTGVQTMDEIDRLMNTTSEDVHLLYDSGHALFAGIDPVLLLKKYAKRVNHVHLKDIRMDVFENKVKKENLSFLNSVVEGVFTVPGDGCIDFSQIFKELESVDYKGWMLVEAEQDPAKANPLEYALKARKYIREQTSL
jgi:inosose dehydratase